MGKGIGNGRGDVLTTSELSGLSCEAVGLGTVFDYWRPDIDQKEMMNAARSSSMGTWRKKLARCMGKVPRGRRGSVIVGENHTPIGPYLENAYVGLSTTNVVGELKWGRPSWTGRDGS